MKAIQISRTGGTDVLEYVDLPTPSPGPGEVLVKATAIGVNYFDTMIRTGRYRWMPKLPFVPGNELSGTVAALGTGVTTLKVGQPRFIAGYEIGNRGGLYAEYAAVPEKAAWPLPESVTAEAATALTNYQLAWILLRHAARGIRPETVVVYGAAGGVGSALIDVARLAGATVIGTAGSAEKCAFVTARGAAHAINYKSESVVERVLALTNGHGAGLRLNIEPTLVGNELEAACETDDGLGPAKRQEAVTLGDVGDAIEHRGFGGLIEIDQHVAAEHHIESAEMRKVVEQVERRELHHAADLRRDLPHLADLREILDQHQRRQAALHFELGVDAALGLLQHLFRDVGGDD